MAVDKLVDSTQLDADLTSIANAIRTKGGTSAQLAFPQGFVDAVEAIETGGDYTAADFALTSKPVGEVVSDANAVARLFGRTEITKLYLPNWTGTGNTASFFEKMPKLAYAIFPAQTRLYNAALSNCSNLIGVDLFAGYLGSTVFGSCLKLKYIVIRKDAVSPLSHINSFNNTPFASGKAGGILYVPADLVASYEATTNWSTILGYSTNQIKSIESTATDPDAPVDLTTHYIDGTPIPTT